MLTILQWILMYLAIGAIFYFIELYKSYGRYKTDQKNSEEQKQFRYDRDKSDALEIILIWPIYLLVNLAPGAQKLITSFAETLWETLNKTK